MKKAKRVKEIVSESENMVKAVEKMLEIEDPRYGAQINKLLMDYSRNKDTYRIVGKEIEDISEWDKVTVNADGLVILWKGMAKLLLTKWVPTYLTQSGVELGHVSTEPLHHPGALKFGITVKRRRL